MSYLVYCIFRGPLPAAVDIPDGLGGYRVFTSNHNGLGAALSKLADGDLPEDASSYQAYERVVESFYRHLTVIPMRYGYRVECPYDAVVLLNENQDAYRALLRELDGFAEVGIQVLLDAPPNGAETHRPGFLPDWFQLRSRLFATVGADGKQRREKGAEGAATAHNALVKNLCDFLHGSFVRHKVEFPSSRESCLLSLHFLVPRESVETFSYAARHLPADPSFQLHLSGPWPPYNFIDSQP